MSVDTSLFRQVLGRFASGVTVVTMAHEGVASGLTVSAFCSLSLNPSYILVCIDKRSSTLELIRQSGSFVVNILSNEQSDLSNHFASKLTDKLSGIPHRIGSLGAPILDGTLAYLECSLVKEIDGGDHYIYIGEVQHTDLAEDKTPLLYYHGKYGQFA